MIYAKGQASACCQVIQAWLGVTRVRELTVTNDVDALEQSFRPRALFVIKYVTRTASINLDHSYLL